MHQLERVTNLLALLLSARRHVTFEEIRNGLRGQYPDNLTAARAAFERDKAILRDEGVPIDSVVLGGDQAGMTGYRILRSDYELGELELDPDEAAALRVAVWSQAPRTSIRSWGAFWARVVKTCCVTSAARCVLPSVRRNAVWYTTSTCR